MPSAHGVVVARRTETEVKLVLTQIIGLRMIAQPGQLQLERTGRIRQVDNAERTLGAVDVPTLAQAERMAVEVDATGKVGHIDIEMVKFCFHFHSHSVMALHEQK